jgi:hypothetical protein
MLQCISCGERGTIDDPTQEEWSEAFHAPRQPYRWHDGTRVHVRGNSPFCVMRATNGPRCECHSRSDRPDGGEYERLPAELIRYPFLTAAERAELGEWAEFVAQSDLCSRLFPLFLRSFEEFAGVRHSKAVHDIADLIEQIDEIGLHCSPSVVAAMLTAMQNGFEDGITTRRAILILLREFAERQITPVVLRRKLVEIMISTMRALGEDPDDSPVFLNSAMWAIVQTAIESALVEVGQEFRNDTFRRVERVVQQIWQENTDGRQSFLDHATWSSDRDYVDCP